jgi:ankyrin repeat protein
LLGPLFSIPGLVVGLNAHTRKAPRAGAAVAVSAFAIGLWTLLAGIALLGGIVGDQSPSAAKTGVHSTAAGKSVQPSRLDSKPETNVTPAASDMVQGVPGAGDGGTPLHRAARAGDTAKVRSLLARGADVNARDGVGWTALQVAAVQNHDDIVRLLVEHGSSVDVGGGDDYPPLVLAALVRNPDMVAFLLANGADPEAKWSMNGMTALQCAADGGCSQVVSVLLAHGADVNSRAKFGTTALHWTAGGSNKRAQPRDYVECVDLLLKAGADVNARDDDGLTPLMSAAYGHLEIVGVLLANGADVNAVGSTQVPGDSGGWTALKSAQREGDERVIRVLIDHGAKPEAKK